MGNYVSCTLAIPLIKNGKAARVILPGGEVRQFREPVKAAELMLDCPNFFLVNSLSLHIGRRFSALGADEELEFGSIYIMFPMKRVNSVVTGVDMTMLFMAANSAAKRISGVAGKVRVSPESGGGSGEAEQDKGLKGNDVDDDRDGGSRSSLLMEGVELDEGFPVPEFNYRLATCRSRKPLLETIKEEPVCSR